MCLSLFLSPPHVSNIATMSAALDTKTRKPTALIIGSGVGGTSTAARLAYAGFEVTVLERNDYTGGRCSLIHHEGHRFDQGEFILLSLSRK